MLDTQPQDPNLPLNIANYIQNQCQTAIQHDVE